MVPVQAKPLLCAVNTLWRILGLSWGGTESPNTEVLSRTLATLWGDRVPKHRDPPTHHACDPGDPLGGTESPNIEVLPRTLATLWGDRIPKHRGPLTDHAL